MTERSIWSAVAFTLMAIAAIACTVLIGVFPRHSSTAWNPPAADSHAVNHCLDGTPAVYEGDGWWHCLAIPAGAEVSILVKNRPTDLMIPRECGKITSVAVNPGGPVVDGELRMPDSFLVTVTCK